MIYPPNNYNVNPWFFGSNQRGRANEGKTFCIYLSNKDPSFFSEQERLVLETFNKFVRFEGASDKLKERTLKVINRDEFLKKLENKEETVCKTIGVIVTLGFTLIGGSFSYDKCQELLHPNSELSGTKMERQAIAVATAFSTLAIMTVFLFIKRLKTCSKRYLTGVEQNYALHMRQSHQAKAEFARLHKELMNA